MATSASALNVVANIGGAPTGVNKINFDDLTLGDTGLHVVNGPNGTVTVDLRPGSQVALGNRSGLYAAPYLSSENGVGFGAGGGVQANGVDTTPYLSTGRTVGFDNGRIILSFAGDQKYLGLLWGSVDTFNHLALFYNDTLVGEVSGSDSAFGGGNGGDQGLNGTRYVNINSDDFFNKVIFTSDNYSFEFDNVSYSQSPVSVADFGSSLGMLALAVIGFGVWTRSRR